MIRTLQMLSGRRLLAVVAAAAVALGLAVALAIDLATGSSEPAHRLSKGPSAGAGTFAGQQLPATAMKRFDATGSEVRLQELAGGKPMFVNIWSTTCEPCKREMPAIEAVYRQMRGKVLFVGVDVSDTAEAGQAFVRQYGITYPQVRDPRAELAAAVGTAGLPTTLLVDRRGRIVGGHLGALTANEIRSLLSTAFGFHLGGGAAPS